MTGGKAAKRKGCGREFGGTFHGGLNDLNELEWENPQNESVIAMFDCQKVVRRTFRPRLVFICFFVDVDFLADLA